MNKFRQYGPLDDVPEPMGDRVFNRLEMQANASTLPPGAVTVSRNFRFGTHGAQPREGLARMLPAGVTLAEIRWAGIYRPQESNDRIALVTQTALILFNPADQSTSASYTFGAETVASTDPVDIIQGGISATTVPDLYILRGLNKTVLKFDGTSVAVNAGFKQGLFGLFYQDRMAVASGDSSLTRSQQIDVSDFLDFATWSPLEQFKVSKGGDDYLIGFMPWQKDYVIAATRKKFFLAFFDPITAATGYAGGLEVATSFLRELTRSGGLVGRRAWLEANGKIWYISDKAIFAFQPQLDLELTVIGEPVSTPIQPILDRLSANYATGADCKALGQRIYFAMPISDEPKTVSGITVDNTPTPNLATLTTDEAHDIQAGDIIQVSRTLDAGLNGIKTVVSVPTSTTLTFDTTAVNGATVGDRAIVQKIATRNNTIAVFNTALGDGGAWESIDVLPRGIYADWLLICDHGAQRRLWLVDKTLGPCLYEEGDVDEFGSATGGLQLPFYLPAYLSSANFNATPVAGVLTSREYATSPTARQVKAGSALLELAATDAGTMTLTAHSPRETDWEADRDFDGADATRVLARKKCGKRAIGAQVSVTSTAGRPVVREIAVEIVQAGRAAED